LTTVKQAQSPEKAILVGVRFRQEDKTKYANAFAELKLLTQTAGAVVSAEFLQTRYAPDHQYFIGKGKVYEVLAVSRAQQADLVIFNETLTPSQQKNLEKLFQTKVLDRVGLILDIFAHRARTQEAKLQVELAQYEYLLPRLTRLWLHFSKQAGHIGTRGPGETQLEADRRRVSARIKLLKKKTAAVRRHHQLLRAGRRRQGAKTVALVGYTNAGKSTLLNVLTKAAVLVEDQLFATLDPTVRQLFLPQQPNVVLVDTVGFIQRLPHQLVAAFKATLEEVVSADLLLHVIDATAPDLEQQIQAVLQVLEEIGAIKKPMVLVFNKIDQAAPAQKAQLKHLGQRLASPLVCISALYQQGLPQLRQVITTQLA
jgi:GTPase